MNPPDQKIMTYLASKIMRIYVLTRCTGRKWVLTGYLIHHIMTFYDPSQFESYVHRSYFVRIIGIVRFVLDNNYILQSFTCRLMNYINISVNFSHFLSDMFPQFISIRPFLRLFLVIFLIYFDHKIAHLTLFVICWYI